MRKIGEIEDGKDIGYAKNSKYIWASCVDCGRERWVALAENKPISARCNSCSRRGKRSGKAWKGGIYIEKKQGYVNIKIEPDDFYYSMSKRNGYVLEHRLVMAKSLGRCLQPWEIVHHKGIRYVGVENKQDNKIDNLELGSHISEHSRNHCKGYKDGYTKGLSDGRGVVRRKVAEEINIPKDLIAWILKRLNGKDAAEFMLRISVGKPSGEG